MERLQKILSARGVLSRRAAERYIQAGRVTVNGVPAVLGQQADPDRDRIAVDGVELPHPTEPVYLLLNKPRGYVTTLSDEQGRKTVAQLVADCGQRVYPVGRLDLNSEGLLLLTNDGELTQRLTHPSHQVEKEYLVRVTGDVEAALPRLRRGMTVEGETYQGAEVRALPSGEQDSALLSFTIRQGKNRQVRKMCAACGLIVHRLRRVREGTLRLGDLNVGSWRYLTTEEIQRLKAL
ncbi:MAG: rRNA pseudouridine synthase [Clostridiales bacterium]|nr:rRNA pseudouridine synthase [Clostridiales bacterium]